MASDYVLVTGGCGYIGSHTVVELLQKGLKVVVVDNLSNSSSIALDRVREIAGKPDSWLVFERLDIRDADGLQRVFEQYRISAVVHFAGLKAVGESFSVPLKYYENNISGTLTLLEVMKRNQCKTIVFSSSATVYGDASKCPIAENSPLAPTNAYGRTKYFVEEILRDLCASDPAWTAVILRYFNPVGAHPSGRIGEDPQGIPNNLLPYIQQVAVGRLPQLSVFGNDWPGSPDGTGVRDYIHVVDLAKGHVCALAKVQANTQSSGSAAGLGAVIYNLGTGHGISVLEMLHAFEAACEKKLPFRITARRSGDVAVVYADATKAEQELSWKATLGVQDMCADAWRWQQSNPFGFNGKPLA